MAAARALALGLLTVAASLVSCASAGGASPAPHSPLTPGYWLVGADGGVFAFNAPFEGSGAPGAGSPGLCAFAFGPGIDINAESLANADGILSRVNCVGIAGSEGSSGCWVADFTFGDAGFHGSMGGKALNAPIVGIAATPDGKGYWLVGSDGGLFAFGDATFYGSMGGHALNQPVTGMAANPDGSGYWLVAADGGIFAFGGAPFEGSMSGTRLNAPIVGMAAAPS